MSEPVLCQKCETRMFPLQAGYSKDARPGSLSIPWSVAEKAYGVYAARYGSSQTLKCLAERGGFGTNEMDALYPKWREEVDEITTLRQKLSEAVALLERNEQALLAAKHQSQRPSNESYAVSLLKEVVQMDSNPEHGLASWHEMRLDLHERAKAFIERTSHS